LSFTTCLRFSIHGSVLCEQVGHFEKGGEPALKKVAGLILSAQQAHFKFWKEADEVVLHYLEGWPKPAVGEKGPCSTATSKMRPPGDTSSLSTSAYA